MLFFLPFLFSSIFGHPLLQSWECGADKHEWSKDFGVLLLKDHKCIQPIQDHMNLCCKVHDNCYDHHVRTGFTQELCDLKFCHCLQDAHDKTKNRDCEDLINNACSAVQTLRNVYPEATPPDDSNYFKNFFDYKPLGLDMKSILDSCPTNKKIVVHCHNIVYLCTTDEHELEKKRSAHPFAESYQDCRATMYDCLRAVIETSSTDECTSTVLHEREKINIYKKITNDGDSINNAYPIVASRMLERCPELNHDLHICYKKFFECDVHARQILHKQFIYDLERMCRFDQSVCEYKTDVTKHPDYDLYDEVRRINITCHQKLKECLNEISNKNEDVIDRSEMCQQAFGMALNRIREKEFYFVGSYDGYFRIIFKPWIDLFSIDI